MEDTTIVALMIGGWAAAFAAGTTVLFIGTKISFRYWLGWLALAFVQLVLSVLMFVLPDDSAILGIGPEGLAVAAFAAISLAVSVQLSISISGHQRMLLALAQECAELRLRIDQLEAGDGVPGRSLDVSAEVSSGVSADVGPTDPLVDPVRSGPRPGR